LKVIIDTNGIMLPAQFGVDIFTELRRLGFDQFLLPAAVLHELDGLVRRCRGKDKIAAKVAISLSERCDVIEGEGFADDVIVRLAPAYDAAVLTNDIGLQQRLKEKEIPIVRLRQKNKLDFL
jgi:hypothetical protein